MKESLREREALSPTGFYDRYYADSGLDQETVVELLEHVADELRLPSGKLRPGDRFSKELSPGEAHGWDSGYGVLIFELNRSQKNVVLQSIGGWIRSTTIFVSWRVSIDEIDASLNGYRRETSQCVLGIRGCQR